jgi:hypothetical protein
VQGQPAEVLHGEARDADLIVVGSEADSYRGVSLELRCEACNRRKGRVDLDRPARVELPPAGRAAFPAIAGPLMTLRVQPGSA